MDPSTLWTGYPFDSCEAGTDAEVTFLELTPIETYWSSYFTADDNKYLLGDDGTNLEKDTSNCIDIGGMVGLAPASPILDAYTIGLNMMMENQQRIQKKKGVSQTTSRF